MEYKLTIFGTNIYKEVELFDHTGSVIGIGTTPKCSVRFNRDYFFSDFEIHIYKNGQQWILDCAPGIYFKSGDALKLSLVTLNVGDTIHVYYEQTDSLIFHMEFMPDYDREVKKYDYYADISGMSQLSIGNGPQCHIAIDDPQLQGVTALLEPSGNTWHMCVAGTLSVAYKNGSRIRQPIQVIENGDFFSLAGWGFFFKDSRLYLSDIRGIRAAMPVRQVFQKGNAMEYPRFLRNTRMQFVLPQERIEILSPKAKSAMPKRNLWVTIIPVLASLMLMVGLRGVMGGGGMFVIYSVATMAVGGAVSVWTYFNDGKEYKEKENERREKYDRYLQDQEARLVALRNKELAILRQKYISVENDVAFVESFDRRLFERQKGDEDFLCVYLGTGTVKSACPVKYKVQEYKEVDDDLMDQPQSIAEKYTYIEGAPVMVRLKELNALGVVGSRNKLYQILKNTVMDLAVRQFYSDVKFYFIFDESDKKQFYWMRWLKNAWDSHTGSRNFMYDEDSEKMVLESLYSELSRREILDKDTCAQLPHYVIFVYKSETLRIHPVARYMENAARYGFTFIFFEEQPELLEKDCDKVITLDPASNQGCVSDAKNSEIQQYFYYDHISTGTAARSARRLACVYVDEVSLEGNLTKNISLYEMLGILNVHDIDLRTQWNQWKIYESMAAPIGVKAGDEIICLDLHEKAHGPHGLVAGTTGSGKSEILQTYILSMAVRFHPYDVGFVIIDFKGGGMVNQFKELPHLNGAITNMDGHQIQRSLMSIRAELRKRQALFARYGVNHIDAYIRKFKAKEADTPLPHLILIVDEFAELKSDQPEFMKELISTARIGRSLGVHLILATQKPSGVVDNQIWSNSRFKLCLKVQNKEDSTEVLKSPLAAEIREPGRAYLQVGNNEIFQLFQSAYSGAPDAAGSGGQEKAYRICRVELSGKRQVLYEQKAKKQGGSRTQLEALVRHIHDFCEKNHIESLPDICLPPLEKKIIYPDLNRDDGGSAITVPVGIYDDPANQRQERAWLNLTENHTFILGSSQYGKTNMLQGILRGIGQMYTPEDVQVYIIDFASMILKNFETMCHVGGVVTSNEDEKLKNLLKLLTSELKVRQEALLRLGVSSFGAYREAGYGDIPQLILMIDNMTALKELYPQYEDTLLTICREGLSSGICVIAANAQTSGIGYKYFANFSGRLALYCNDAAEYGYLFEHCRMRPENTAGRGLLSIDKTIYEFQAYLAFDAEKEIDKTGQIRDFIQLVNKNNEGSHARRIPEIPRVLDENYIKAQFGTLPRMAYDVYLGLNFANTQLETLALADMSVLGVSGKAHSGKTNFIRYILGSLLERSGEEPVQIYIFDGIEKKLEVFKDHPLVKTYTLDAQAVCETMTEVAAVLSERYEHMISGDESQASREPLLVLVLQNRDCVSAVSSNKEAMDAYRQITGRFKALKVLILLSDMENAAINFSSPEVLKLFKDNRNLVIFDDLSSQKLYDVPLAVAREYSKALESGEAYYISGNTLSKIKTVKVTGSKKAV